MGKGTEAHDRQIMERRRYSFPPSPYKVMPVETEAYAYGNFVPPDAVSVQLRRMEREEEEKGGW